jgi:hypothetical protein
MSVAQTIRVCENLSLHLDNVCQDAIERSHFVITEAVFLGAQNQKPLRLSSGTQGQKVMLWTARPSGWRYRNDDGRRFYTLQEARIIIEQWRRHYLTLRLRVTPRG